MKDLIGHIKWICKYNPANYELYGAASDPALKGGDLWKTTGKQDRKKPNAERLREGDWCFFWKTGEPIEMVGYGIVKRRAHRRVVPQIYAKYSKDPNEFEPGREYEVIEISYERMFSLSLPLDTLRADPAWTDQVFHEALTERTLGTFYELTAEDLAFLQRYILLELDLEMIRQLGPDAITILLENLTLRTKSDEELISNSAWILGQFKEVKAMEPLIACLTDERGSEAVSFALAELGEIVLPSLLKWIKEGNSDQRINALITLGYYFKRNNPVPTGTVEVIMNCLAEETKKPDSNVLQFAIDCLLDLRNEDTMKQVIEPLKKWIAEARNNLGEDHEDLGEAQSVLEYLEWYLITPSIYDVQRLIEAKGWESAILQGLRNSIETSICKTCKYKKFVKATSNRIEELEDQIKKTSQWDKDLSK